MKDAVLAVLIDGAVWAALLSVAVAFFAWLFEGV